MSGHSKWANIKRKKEINDKAKGTNFAKLSRLISTAVAEGGGVTNPESNIKLRLFIDKAKEANMPKDTIARAVEKGIGVDKNQYSHVTYEAFGPSGSSFLIFATTNNHNRTSNEMKNILDMNSAKLGSPGSVSYLFQHCGIVMFDARQSREEQVLQFAEKINAIDIENSDGTYFIYFDGNQIVNLQDNLDGLTPLESAKTLYRPLSSISVNSADSEKISQLIEALENMDDVHEVYTNAVES